MVPGGTPWGFHTRDTGTRVLTEGGSEKRSAHRRWILETRVLTEGGHCIKQKCSQKVNTETRGAHRRWTQQVAKLPFHVSCGRFNS